MPEGLINFIDSSFIWIISSLNLYEGAERQECLGEKKELERISVEWKKRIKRKRMKRIPWNGEKEERNKVISLDAKPLQGSLCQRVSHVAAINGHFCVQRRRSPLFKNGHCLWSFSLSTHSRASLQGCFHPTWRLCVYDAVVEFFLFFFYFLLLLPWTKSAESSSPAAAADPIDGQGCESWGRPNPKKELEQQQPRRSWNNKQTRYSYSLCFLKREKKMAVYVYLLYMMFRLAT